MTKTWLVHEKTCKRYDLINEHTRFPHIPLPCTGLEKYTETATKAQVKAFQERVGSLTYTAVMIRADVAFAASELAKHLQNPGPAHLAAADQALRYWSRNTRNSQEPLHISFQPSFVLTGNSGYNEVTSLFIVASVEHQDVVNVEEDHDLRAL